MKKEEKEMKKEKKEEKKFRKEQKKLYKKSEKMVKKLGQDILENPLDNTPTIILAVFKFLKDKKLFDNFLNNSSLLKSSSELRIVIMGYWKLFHLDEEI